MSADKRASDGTLRIVPLIRIVSAAVEQGGLVPGALGGFAVYERKPIDGAHNIPSNINVLQT
jgi:hypothetical protein